MVADHFGKVVARFRLPNTRSRDWNPGASFGCRLKRVSRTQPGQRMFVALDGDDALTTDKLQTKAGVFCTVVGDRIKVPDDSARKFLPSVQFVATH